MARTRGGGEDKGRRFALAGADQSPLLADHIELAGAQEAGVAAGSEILTVQELRIEEIDDVIRRRTGRAARVSAVAVFGDLDHIRIDVHAARPGVARGHGDAAADRLRAELEELTSKPVELHVVREEGPGTGRTG